MKIKNFKKFAQSKKTLYLCTRFRKTTFPASIGEMAEWSIATVLKTVVPQGTGGSNPSLSASTKKSCQINGNSFLFDIGLRL